MKLGFSIGCNVFGYRLVIPHYGTIVVNNEVRAGIILSYIPLHVLEVMDFIRLLEQKSWEG